MAEWNSFNAAATGLGITIGSCGNTVPWGAGGYFPQIAASKDGTRFFMIWSGNNSIYATVYDNNWNIVKNTFAIESVYSSPNVRVKDIGNNNFVVAWWYSPDWVVPYSTHYQVYNNDGTATSPIYNIPTYMVNNLRIAEYNNGANFAISGLDQAQTTLNIKWYALSAPNTLVFNQGIYCATAWNQGTIWWIGTDLIVVHNCNNIATGKRYTPAGGLVWNKTLWSWVYNTWHDDDTLAVRYDNLWFFLANNIGPAGTDIRVRYFDTNGNLVWSTPDTIWYSWLSMVPMRKTGLTDRVYITDASSTVPFWSYKFGSYMASSSSYNLFYGILASEIDSTMYQVRIAPTQTQAGIAYNWVGNAISFKLITFPTVQCAPGSYSPTSFPPCTAASIGYYVPTTGAITQTICPANTYQASTGQSSCTACPGWTNSPAGSTSASQCLIACPSGYTYIWATCVSPLRRNAYQTAWDQCISEWAVMTRANQVMTWCPITGGCSNIGDASYHLAWNPSDRNNYWVELVNSVSGRCCWASWWPISTYYSNTFPTAWASSTTDPINWQHYYYCTK